MVKALNDYVFDVEGLRSGDVYSTHGSRLKYYRAGSLDKNVIRYHMLSSKTGIPRARLLKLIEVDTDIKFQCKFDGKVSRLETVRLRRLRMFLKMYPKYSSDFAAETHPG